MQERDAHSRRLPGFVKGWMITDIVLEGGRVLLIPIVWVGFLQIPPSMMRYVGMVELTLAILLPACGLAAAIGILCRQRWALVFGYATAAITMLSCIEGALSGFFLASDQPAEFNRAVTAGSALLTICVRLTLLVFYVLALNRAKTELARTPEPAPETL